MSSFSLQFQAWKGPESNSDRRTPTEGVISSYAPHEGSNSPMPGASFSSHSSPGSYSQDTHHALDLRSPYFGGYTGVTESKSLGSFRPVTSSSSFDTAPNYHRSNSALSNASESNADLLVPMHPGSASFPPVPKSTPAVKIGAAGAPKSPTSRGGAVKPTVTRRGPTKTKPSNKKKNEEAGEEGPTTNRRQKRLQRNRESARLSRRRRKQYLEVLEEKVNTHSEELDRGRREHVSKAIETITKKRDEILDRSKEKAPEDTLVALETKLSRTSEELMVCTTFQKEQIKSLVLPPNQKFTLWLTLQADQYFRGGRAASERLSAARIGERMLSNGNDKATPMKQMWPLLCNEITLSYEQEEKVRNFQKSVLLDQDSWLDRHGSFASAKVIESTHDAIQALTLRSGQRERSGLNVLNSDQRLKFLSWANRNREKAQKLTLSKVGPTLSSDNFKTSKEQHVAANLYVLNHRLHNILNIVPRAAPLITGKTLKKLSRRPLFESLAAQDEKDTEKKLSRENSFASSGSLKRNYSEMSMESEEKLAGQIKPVEAQKAAQDRVDEVLFPVRSLIPSAPVDTEVAAYTTLSSHISNRPPNHVVSDPQFAPIHYMHTPNPIAAMPAPVSMSSMDHTPIAPYPVEEKNHVRKSSFLPADLNVVPEEMWPEETEDFLMDLVDGDWAIGEGVDMDHLG